jgi:hypothetical protein
MDSQGSHAFQAQSAFKPPNAHTCAGAEAIQELPVAVSLQAAVTAELILLIAHTAQQHTMLEA